MTSCLMVIPSEDISCWVDKGEVIDRYFNPGNVFDEVHIVLINGRDPNEASMQKMVGRAQLFVHNITTPNRFGWRTLGWQRILMRGWINRMIELAAEVRPNLIRCHGANINAVAARCIKRALDIPYVVSMHINPDIDIRARAYNWKDRLMALALIKLEKEGLRNANLVLPVYLPIVPYLQRIGVTKFDVAYNVLNPSFLSVKNNYRLHNPIRIVSVGRQIAEKNPTNIILAIAQIPNSTLTIFGDGPMHGKLHKLVDEIGISDRVNFMPAVPNDELCRLLIDFDIFAVHSEYWEISKSVLEPLLTGLPVVINRRKGECVPELSDDICVLVKNTVDGYLNAISRLITDDDFREKLGRHAHLHSQALWSPEASESKFARVYRQYMRPY